MVRRIDRSEADWGHSLAPVFMDPALGLAAKYGINNDRFFVKPGLTLRMLAFNASRPLFRNNPKLRQAINFALDRQALVASTGGPIAGRPTDQYLPHGIPGFRDSNVYPLESADLPRARARSPVATCEARRRSSIRRVPRRRSKSRSSSRSSSRGSGSSSTSGRFHSTSRRRPISRSSRHGARSGTSRSWSGRPTSPSRTRI